MEGSSYGPLEQRLKSIYAERLEQDRTLDKQANEKRQQLKQRKAAKVNSQAKGAAESEKHLADDEGAKTRELEQRHANELKALRDRQNTEVEERKKQHEHVLEKLSKSNLKAKVDLEAACEADEAKLEQDLEREKAGTCKYSCNM